MKSAASAETPIAVPNCNKAVGDAVMVEDADRIAAEAEICGMAKAHHSAISQDEVEAQCRDAEHHDAREKIEIERLVHGVRDERHEDERRETHDDRAFPAVEPHR